MGDEDISRSTTRRAERSGTFWHKMADRGGGSGSGLKQFQRLSLVQAAGQNTHCTGKQAIPRHEEDEDDDEDAGPPCALLNASFVLSVVQFGISDSIHI